MSKHPSEEILVKPVWERIAFLSILLVCTRFYLMPLFGLGEFSRVALVIPPFVILIRLGFKILSNVKAFVELLLSKKIALLSCVLVVVHLVVQLTIFKTSINSFFVYCLPITYFILFPSTLYLLNVEEGSLVLGLNILTKLIIWICGPLILMEYFLNRSDLLPAVILQSYLLSNPLWQNIGDSYEAVSALRLGPLVISVSSAALMVGASSYQLGSFIQEFSSLSLRERAFTFITVLLGAVSIIYLDSITPVLAFFIACSLAISRWAMKSRFGKRSFWAVSSVVLFVAIVFFRSNTFHRIVKYATIEREMVSRAIPTFNNCSIANSLWVTNLGVANGCDLGEIHLLKKTLDTVGIIPMLPWLAWFFLPLFLVFFRDSVFRAISSPSFICIVSIYLCSLHYSPVEAWGVNYLFFLAVLTYFVEVNNVRRERGGAGQ